MITRVTISINQETLAKIDAYCAENKLGRSQFFTNACTEYITAKSIEPELKKALEELAQKVDELAQKAGAESAVSP